MSDTPLSGSCGRLSVDEGGNMPTEKVLPNAYPAALYGAIYAAIDYIYSVMYYIGVGV